MNNAAKGEKTIKELVIKNCWQYLYENFHKFKEPNKIKIALELCKKDLPTELTGSPLQGETKIIIIRDGDKTKTLARQVCVQQEEVSRAVVGLGDRQNPRLNLAGDVIQRADSE